MNRYLQFAAVDAPAHPNASADGFVNPKLLTPEQKTSMLNAIEANEITSIRHRAYVYADARNANDSRLRPDYLAVSVDNANAAADPSILAVDHGRNTALRVGSVSRYAIEPLAGKRWVSIDATIVDKKAMSDFVRGKLDRYSLALHPASRMTCSVCGTDWDLETEWYPKPQCPHVPGVDGCEVFLEAEIRETSFVPFPAVTGTHTYSRQESKMPGQKNDNTEPAELAQVTVPATLELSVDAKLAAAEARAKASDERAKAAAERYRELVLEQAVRENKVLPAELPRYRKVWDALGEEECVGLFSSRQAVATPGEQTGAPAATPQAQSKPATTVGSILQLADKFYSLGELQTMPTEARLRELKLVR